jgi:ATP-dependent DNA helicase RecQ
VTLDWLTAPVAEPEQPLRESAVRRKLARATQTTAAAPPPPDESIREALREWRRAKAKESSVPAYVILHDTTLDALCRYRPKTLAKLLEIPGIGERKAERFGAEILERIAAKSQ